MKDLNVYIEINGDEKLTGRIVGNSYKDASFIYDDVYMNSGEGMPISVSLPFQNEGFSPERTKSFFESLLPEGFSRRAVAGWVKSDESDYITILEALGKECLGAVKISNGEEEPTPEYEELSLAEVKALAAEGATKSTQILMETHLSLTGASGKVGLLYDRDNDKWYLPKGKAPSTHIVKQSHVRLDRIVLNEQLCMITAKNSGIDVPESFIVDTGSGQDDQVLFATQRYDRLLGQGKVIDGIRSPIRLHQEDFAQALGIPPENKYEKEKSGYLAKIFDLIQDNSDNPIEDKTKLLERIVFSYLIGNTDCHIKNISFIYSKDLRSLRLAPAYDIVATQVYNTTPKMSFYIGNEIDISKVNRSCFIEASSEMSMSSNAVGRIFDRIADRFETALLNATDELCDMGYSEAVSIRDKILKRI
ncbi:MAG: HipA domain-containing protein [Lachnospiraceae bacterium]|nr:HipA domain-containing protein [Lachnospiraceae bacterium]